jgi:N-acyl-D-aspartate/D-glutamate deacylase
LLSGHHTTYSLFDAFPAYQQLKAQNLSEQALYERLCDPQIRESIVGWQPDEATAKSLAGAFDRTFLLGDPPDYEPGPDRSLTGIALANSTSPLNVAYDAMLIDGGRGLLYVPILNYAYGNLDPVREMFLHPRAASGLADGGAHCGVICDASMPTFMLTHWTRDRSRGDTLPLEMIIKKQTQDTAMLYGLSDRGTLKVGMLGDVNIIDYENLQLESPFVTSDLPAGGTRLVQGARGYVATIKSGEITFDRGQDTGARPGQLLRGAR